ncbi:hypothetical protein IAT40_001773 [Kwoniella sp. CBS 6097]
MRFASFVSVAMLVLVSGVSALPSLIPTRDVDVLSGDQVFSGAIEVVGIDIDLSTLDLNDLDATEAPEIRQGHAATS